MKRIIIILVAILIAYAVYMSYVKKVKEQYATGIKERGNSGTPLAGLLPLNLGYLKAWYEASLNNRPEFVYKGNAYITKGGKRKQ